jgi:hypothetical protein
MASEGQRRPGLRDAASLLLHGLRARLGRPRSRIIVPLTLVAMLIGGLCAAAGGARLGWGGSPELHTSQMSTLERVAQGDGNDLQQAMIIPGGVGGPFRPYLSYDAAQVDWFDNAAVPNGDHGLAAQAPPLTMRQLVDNQRSRLEAAGWTVTGTAVRDTGATMTARNGSVVAKLVATTMTAYTTTDSSSSITVQYGAPPNVGTVDGAPAGFVGIVYRATPGTVPAAAITAGIIGAVATYLLIGWLSRRTARLPDRPDRVVRAVFAVGGLLSIPGATICGAGIWAALRGERGGLMDGTHPPIRFWGGFTEGGLQFVALAAAALLVIAVIGAVGTRPAERPAERIAE